jgi:acetoin utilization deacetylase AcuC-like enzyme
MTTGYVYDPIFLEHNLRGHPESAQRLEHTMDFLRERGMMERLVAIEPRQATIAELERVHTPEHIAHVRRVAERGGGHMDADTYVAPRSYEAALVAAGGTVAATEAILDGEVDNAFALVRPPGHHATASRAMGFCLFNNVAVAAAAALTHPEIERVLIFDFDVHHGNGTQDIFVADPRVFYASTHEYPFYPGTGHWSEMGTEPGEGSILNVPLPAGVGDEGYARILERLLWPLARHFEPDMLFVSAGYDAHWQDPLAAMALSLAGYAHIARELVDMAQVLSDGRILFLLEGGYDLVVLAHGVLNAFYALLGEDEIVDPLGGTNQGRGMDVEPLIARLREAHALSD